MNLQLNFDIPIHQDYRKVTDYVAKLMKIIGLREMSIPELMHALVIKHKGSFRSRYLKSAIIEGYVEMNIPKKPKSKNQKYKLSSSGLKLLEGI